MFFNVGLYDPSIPPDVGLVCLPSTTAAELGCFNSSQWCVSTPPQPSTADLQDFYFSQMPEHNAAIRHGADRAGQDVRHRYDIKISD